MYRRKICIVTGTRAEYGLLYWLMKEINDDDELELQIIATGMHLSPEFGLTYKNIETDGFNISAKVEMLLSSDTPVGITKSIGLAVVGFADVLEQLKPDILVLLGDRYEILAAAQAALVARIPVAHLHGGETTEGAMDEAIRHSITKMAHLHFVAAEPYRQRVIQLGEIPDNVFNYGAPGLDNINRLELLSREEFERSINFSLGKLNFLVTYHPVTLGSEDPYHSMQQLLAALAAFPNAKIILTKPNSDTGGRIISQLIDQYAQLYHERVYACTSLGQVRYLSALKYCDVVIGNSSSGIIEAPFLKTPTVNIGNRQCGRLQARSIISCPETSKAIIEAIQQALSPEFQQILPGIESVYGQGDTSRKIKERLKQTNLDGVTCKKFYDIS